MTPAELGFGEPCADCIAEFCEWLPYCHGFNPFDGEGRLQPVPDKAVSHEGLIYAYLCRRCGCRWQVFDWQICGCVAVAQQTPDGEYSATVNYVDGKKHGDFRYHWDWRGDERVGTLILGERWEHGRLIDRNEWPSLTTKYSSTT